MVWFELDLDLIRLGDLGDNILLLCLGEEFGLNGIIWFIKEFLIRKFCNKVYIVYNVILIKEFYKAPFSISIINYSMFNIFF